jgi:hypothetical protein
MKTEKQFDRIDLLEFRSKDTVYVTLSMLCTHARMKGIIYFQFIEGGQQYKLQAIADYEALSIIKGSFENELLHFLMEAHNKLESRITVLEKKIKK